MNDDIEFSVGLDTSSAEEKLNRFEQRVRQDASKSIPYQGTPQPAVFTPSGDNAWDRMRLTQERNLARRQASAGWKALNSPTLPEAEKRMVELQASQRSKDAETFDGLLKRLKETNKLTEEQDIKQEEISGETKSQSKEYNQHHLKLGKTITLLGAILALVKSIKNAWSAAFERQGELNQSLGFFSADREGAFVANTDKTHAMVYAGLRNLGKASPFSSGAYDSAMGMMQGLRFKALRGEGIGDDQYVIAMQRLSDKYGLGLNAKDLLTNGQINLTDILNSMMRSVEDKVLPQLAKTSGVEKELITGDLLKVFGPELMNAMMAHLNQRYNTGSKLTAIDEVIARGGNEVTNVNIARSAKELTSAFSEVKESWKQLGDVVLTDITPALVKFANGLKFIIDKFKDWFHWTPEVQDEEGNAIPTSVTQWQKSTSGLYNFANDVYLPFGKADRKEFSKYRITNNKERANQVFAKRSSSLSDVFQALAYSSDAWDANTAAERAENMSMENQLKAVYNLYKSGKLADNQYSAVYANSLQGRLGKIAYSMEKGMGYDTWKLLLGETGGGDILKEAYGEGGQFDIGANDFENLWGYVTKGLSVDQYMQVAKGFAGSLVNDTTGGVINRASVYWDDANRDKVMQYGEVKLKVSYNDPKGRELTEIIQLDSIRN